MSMPIATRRSGFAYTSSRLLRRTLGRAFVPFGFRPLALPGVLGSVFFGWVFLGLGLGLGLGLPGMSRAESPPGRETLASERSTTIAEIEACASRNLPATAGVIGFRVDAVDRTGAVTASRAELRWRKPGDEQTQILLVVSEPAKTAGTALLIIDRQADKPEFFVRLPAMKKVKEVKSRRLRGPVLGTNFSYEDLKRLREPIDRAELDLIGIEDLAGQPAWVLETIPSEEDDSEYSRVLTFVDQGNCLPVRIDLFEPGAEGEHRLRKRLVAPPSEIRPVGVEGGVMLPHQFVMEDLQRETETIVRIESFEASADLPAEQFTRAALQESVSVPSAASPR
jgi:hypothetical protein